MCEKSIMNAMSPFLTAFAFATVSSFATMASAATPPTAEPLYPWKTESATDDKTGALKHCLVKNVFNNGTLLILAENHEGAQRLAVHFPEDALEKGLLIDLTLQVDSNDVFPVEGMTSTSRILAMNIPEALPEQLRKGNVLRIRGPEDEIAYQLKGTDAAVQALRDCVTSHKNPSLVRTKLAAISDADADIIAQQTSPRATIPAEMAPVIPNKLSLQDTEKNLGLDMKAATAPIKQADAKAKTIAKAEPSMPAVPVPVVKSADIPKAGAMGSTKAKDDGNLPQAWQTIFTTIGMAPQSKIGTARDLGLVPPLQYAWSVDASKIGFNTGNTLDKTGLEQSAKHYMFALRQACKGEFVAEASEQNITSNGYLRWQIAETICAIKGKETITALLFASSAEKSVLLAIESDLKNAAQAIRARNAFLEAVNAP